MVVFGAVVVNDERLALFENVADGKLSCWLPNKLIRSGNEKKIHALIHLSNS